MTVTLKHVRLSFAIVAAVALFLSSSLWTTAPAAEPADSAKSANTVAWPAATKTARPWTRWWWLGSAVDDADITRLMEEYHKAGLGGVEITCIYGVRGAEAREIPYLSEKWRGVVRHSIDEAKRLGMGVDLPTGSGWRTGGPSVTEADANMQLVIEHGDLIGGAKFERTYEKGRLQALVAYGNDNQIEDLINKVDDAGHIAWDMPPGKWTIYTVTNRWSRDNVKRPAPGGEGRNINPLSRRSVMNFLNWFAEELDGLPADGIRAQFHDSYEYEGNWCDDFFAQFEKRRGYRLQDHLPALADVGDADEIARVKHDYRETVSDLILDEFIKPWTDWSHAHGMLARNQSHGSPANWLDLYGAVDIPETESFGKLVGGDGHPLVFKFASSAAHVMGRPLVSSETATWIDEHFNETLGEVKEMTDRVMLAGVNHIFFHGTAYSPKDAAWPGWLFYASTQLNPQNPIWRDFPALNTYVTRCQSMLQSTKPDNDILLYWPIHDTWQNYRGMRLDLRVHNARAWLFDTPFGKAAEWLDENGYTFDYISDRQLAECQVVNGRIQAPGGTYATIIVPGAKYMPLATAEKLTKLADAGAAIVVDGAPGMRGVPGIPQGDDDKKLAAIVGNWTTKSSASSSRIALIGKGKVACGPDIATNLRLFKIRNEDWNQGGKLPFVRQTSAGGHVYFIKNNMGAAVDAWIAPADDFAAAAIMDPLDGRIGLADTRDGSPETPRKSLRLKLEPGATAFVKTFAKAPAIGKWKYPVSSGEKSPIRGDWSVEFLNGGPELSTAKTIDYLDTWTKFAAPAGENFAGTARYSIKFAAPKGPGDYRLNLGEVADSAEVQLNGKPMATLIVTPFVVNVELAAENELVVDVTNVAANRIRDMDRQKIAWRIFKDINLVSLKYGKFDASNWPVREAGLLGPVTLEKLQ